MAFWAIFRGFWAIILPTFGVQVGFRVWGLGFGLQGLQGSGAKVRSRVLALSVNRTRVVKGRWLSELNYLGEPPTL